MPRGLVHVEAPLPPEKGFLSLLICGLVCLHRIFLRLSRAFSQPLEQNRGGKWCVRYTTKDIGCLCHCQLPCCVYKSHIECGWLFSHQSSQNRVQSSLGKPYTRGGVDAPTQDGPFDLDNRIALITVTNLGKTYRLFWVIQRTKVNVWSQRELSLLQVSMTRRY